MLTLTLRLAIITIACSAFGLQESRGNVQDDDDPNWIRMCTLTSNGSSKLNFTMPCGIRIGNESETAVLKRRPEDDYLTSTNGQEDDDRRYIDSDHFENHHKVRNETAVVFDESTKITNGPEVTDGVTVEEDGSGLQDDMQDIVTVQAASEADGNPQDKLERQRPATMKKAILTYLTSARNQLYDKIKYLLDSLQRAFFNAQLRRKNRRDLVGRQMKSTSKRNMNLSKKKQSNMMSVVTEPSFERSLMTMSFLVFGVFIIQVIQRLMQTFQKSDSYGSLGNSLTSSLSTPPSRMFNT